MSRTLFELRAIRQAQEVEEEVASPAGKPVGHTVNVGTRVAHKDDREAPSLVARGWLVGKASRVDAAGERVVTMQDCCNIQIVEPPPDAQQSEPRSHSLQTRTVADVVVDVG